MDEPHPSRHSACRTRAPRPLAAAIAPALTGLLARAFAALAAAHWTVTDLGVLGGHTSSGLRINTAGQIIGQADLAANVTSRPFQDSDEVNAVNLSLPGGLINQVAVTGNGVLLTNRFNAGLAAGAVFDAYRVTAALNFGGTLKFVSFSGFVAQSGQRLDLFNWGSSSGRFDAIDTSGFSLADGTVLDTSQLCIEGTVNVQAVPAPGAWSLLLLGLGGTGAAVRLRMAPRCRMKGAAKALLTRLRISVPVNRHSRPATPRRRPGPRRAPQASAERQCVAEPGIPASARVPPVNKGELAHPAPVEGHTPSKLGYIDSQKFPPSNGLV